MRSRRLKIPSPGADASPPHHNACPKGIEADSRSEPAAHGYHRAPVREVVDTPFFPRTGANRRGHHALSLAPSVSCFGRNEHGVSVWRLARCHDTDDTNRGADDTRTIRWMVKMACSETFEISIDWRPERHPLPEWRYETVPTEPPPSRTRIMASCPGSCLETDHEPRVMGSPQPCFPQPTLAQSKYVAAPPSRGWCWCN
jgi:hypothetical protein